MNIAQYLFFKAIMDALESASVRVGNISITDYKDKFSVELSLNDE